MHTRFISSVAVLAAAAAIAAQTPSSPTQRSAAPGAAGGAMGHGDFGMVQTNVGATYTYSGGPLTNHFEAHAAYKLLTVGTFAMSANARYSAVHADFAAGDLNAPLDPGAIGLNGTHSSGQAGLSLAGRTRLFDKPLMLFATLTTDWGCGRLQRVSGMAAGVVMLTMTRTTQFGIGPAVLVNTTSKFPVFPAVFYRRQLGERVALNLMGNIYGVDCTLGRNTLLTAGCDVYMRSFYFRPGVKELPRHCRYQSTSFRPSLKLRQRLLPKLVAELQGGVVVKMSSRITGATGTHRYAETAQPARLFVQLAATYSL